MTQALYLRPASLAQWPHFDDQVKAWLRAEGIEPVDVGEHELVVCLPYDGGGNYYHADVSIMMAQRILDTLAIGGEVRWICLSGTDVDGDDSLTEVHLRWAVNFFGGKPTLAIMPMDEVDRADREICEEGQLNDSDLGVRWKPKPPPTPRRPGEPLYAQVITLGERRR